VKLHFLQSIVITLALTTLSSHAADDCSYVRLDDPGGSMEHVHLRNQLVGDCYAYAAANLVDAFRFSHGSRDYNRPSIPDYSAAENKSLTNYKTIAEGYVASVLGTMKTFGVCAPDETTVVQKNGAKLAEKLQDIVQLYSIAEADLQLENTKNGIRVYRSDISKPYCDLMASNIADLFPSVAVLLQNFKDQNATQTAFDSYEKLCAQNMVPINIPEPEEPGGQDREGKKETIDSLLSQKNPQPIGLTFDHSVYRQGRSYSGNDITGHERADHAVIIIGRRRGSGNQCQYLVRDNANICDKKISNFDVSKDWDCFDGNAWIDSDQLMKSADQLTWIPTKK
jgi:hypothetical protein